MDDGGWRDGRELLAQRRRAKDVCVYRDGVDTKFPHEMPADEALSAGYENRSIHCSRTSDHLPLAQWNLGDRVVRQVALTTQVRSHRGQPLVAVSSGARARAIA